MNNYLIYKIFKFQFLFDFKIYKNHEFMNLLMSNAILLIIPHYLLTKTYQFNCYVNIMYYLLCL